MIVPQQQQPHPLLQERIRPGNIVHLQRAITTRHPLYAPLPLPLPRQQQQPHPLRPLPAPIPPASIALRLSHITTQHRSYVPLQQLHPQQQPQLQQLHRPLLQALIPPANIAIRLRPTTTQPALCAREPRRLLLPLATRLLNIARQPGPLIIRTPSSARLQPRPPRPSTPTVPVSTAHPLHSTTTRMLTAARHRLHTPPGSIASRLGPTTIR